MHVFTIVFASELEKLFTMMAKSGPAFTKTVRKRTTEFERLFPTHNGRCFCRRRLRCACPADAVPVAGTHGRCGACRERLTCDCVDAHMALELAVIPSVPVNVSVAGESMRNLRLVNKSTLAAYKECMTHVRMTTVITAYRTTWRALAGVKARESVVGSRVGCCVGECSRCHGNIHQCNCSVFTCRCEVCVWVRYLMHEEYMQVIVPVNDVDLDDDYRGDKPERVYYRTPRALSLYSHTRDDQSMLAEYTRLRRLSFERYMSPCLTAAEEGNTCRGDPAYDESLDSEIEDSDEYEDASDD